MRSCVGKPCAIALIGKLELLLVSTVSPGASETNCLKSTCLMSSFSGMHSITSRTSAQCTSSSAAAACTRLTR